MTQCDNLYAKIIKHAEQHGRDSDLDHEVGDLQQALGAAMELLPAGRVKELERKLFGMQQEGFE